MSLGVLNNISAVYAENNLNNTNNSLSNVLQQLSSGSKINSGADDAAGLHWSTAFRPTNRRSRNRRPTHKKASAFCRSPMAHSRRSQACSTGP